MAQMWGQFVLIMLSLISNKLQTAIYISLMSGQHPGTAGYSTHLCQYSQVTKAVWWWHPHSAREKPLLRHSYTGRRWVLAAQTALAEDGVNGIGTKYRFAFLWANQSCQSTFVKFPLHTWHIMPAGAGFSPQNHKLWNKELLSSFPLESNCDLRSLSYHQFILRK